MAGPRHSGYLAAFLGTAYARHQILAEVYGGVIDHVDEIHVARTLCPKPPPDAQRRIGDLIRRAYAFRDEANRLEDAALEAVDTAVQAFGNPEPS